jgi:hypothetical protein
VRNPRRKTVDNIEAPKKTGLAPGFFASETYQLRSLRGARAIDLSRSVPIEPVPAPLLVPIPVPVLVVVSVLLAPVRGRADVPVALPGPLEPVVSLAEVGAPLTLPPGPGTALPDALLLGEVVVPEVWA